MGKLFVAQEGNFTIRPGMHIVHQEDLQTLYDANELMEKSREQAGVIEQKAHEVYQKRYEEGLEQGRDEGKGEYTMKIMEMVMTQVDSLQGLEQQLTEVVISSVEKMLGAFDPGDLAVRVVRKALAAVRGEKRILVRVSPKDEPVVRQDLQSFLISDDGRSGYIDVRPDPNLPHGGCVLETPLGVVNAGLSSQLKILKQALRSKAGDHDGA